MNKTLLYTLLGILAGIIIMILLYYLLLKKKRKVGDITICRTSMLCFLLVIINLFKKHKFTAILNPLSNRLHIISIQCYDSLKEDSVLFCHELVHYYQALTLGRIRFLFAYIFESMKKGYEKNIYERQARHYELKGTPDFEIIHSEIVNKFANIDY